MDPIIEDLCGAVDDAAMMRHLEVFARRVKLSGTPEELESFQYLREQLQSFGLPTTLTMHDAYISLPGKASLVVGDLAPQCITHSFSHGSPPAGIHAPVIYAKAGSPEDFAGLDVSGKIVLVEGIATPAVSVRASRAGALGQIHISPVDHLYEMCISPVWGSPTEEQRELLPTTVVVTIRVTDGERIKAHLAAGNDVQAELHAEVDTGWRKTPLLEANIEAGQAQDDSFVLFSGHHDTWYCGLMDNGGANAVMLEAARIFSQYKDKLKRHLRICFWSGHSHGRYSGSSWYSAARYHELHANCAAHVNIDSVGAQGNTVLVDALSSNELFAVAKQAVKQWGGQDLAGQRMSRAGDQSFWGIGVPAVFMAMGEQPAGSGHAVMGPAVSGSGKRKGAGFGWWWHTPDDTLDKIDPELLVRDAHIYFHTIGRLLTDQILPLDVGRQADMLGHELAGLAADLQGRMDLSSPIAGTATLGLLARELGRLARLAPASLQAQVNRTLMSTCRDLVPIDYTSGDRFGQDPAVKQGAYPSLDPLRTLGRAPAGSDEALFRAVAARRALNRIEQALMSAQEKMRAGIDLLRLPNPATAVNS